MSNNSQEIVHEGWLTKSPPSKPIWRARWRRRWFVLRNSGDLPGQYNLEYYTDRNCRKLKGKIDLDQCDQVDSGLQFENSKQKYQFMFDLKTPKRTYYLAAESSEDMNKWVEYVCHVCRLIAFKEDDEEDEFEYAVDHEAATVTTNLARGLTHSGRLGTSDTESPPILPSSTTSGPYIPLRECISGRPLSTPNALEDLNAMLRRGGYVRLNATKQYTASGSSHLREPVRQRVPSTEGASQRFPLLPVKRPAEERPQKDEFYDFPRQLHPTFGDQHNHGTPPTSPTTDGESVFTDDEWVTPVLPMPSVNWETFPNADGENVRPGRVADGYEGDSDIGSWSVVRKFGKLTVVDSKKFSPASLHGRRNQTLPHKPAPPRPPKPMHMIDMPSHNYLNLENVTARSTRPKPSPVPIVAPAANASTSEAVPPSPKPTTPPLTPVHTEIILGIITDETYDFPRSHQHQHSNSETDGSEKGATSRHCYTNAAPSRVNGDIFRYDFHHDDSPLTGGQELVSGLVEEPTSPRSEGSSSLASTTAVYSNQPSPLVLTDGGSVWTPPAVNRGLKPGRKLSDSVSGSELSPGPTTPGHFPPSVDRKLKPSTYLNVTVEEGSVIQLAPPPDGTRSLRKTRAAPSPTPPAGLRNGLRHAEHASASDEDNAAKDEEVYYHQQANHRFVPASLGHRFPEIHYLDLAHDAVGASSSSINMATPERVGPSTTVYKTVDFLKTQAFNITRQKVEQERKKCKEDIL